MFESHRRAVDLMFTEFETTLRASYSHRTTYFTREILFISRNISFTSLSSCFLSRGPWCSLSAKPPHGDPVALDQVLLREVGAHVLDKGVCDGWR
jgi:hypothetical protein